MRKKVLRKGAKYSDWLRRSCVAPAVTNKVLVALKDYAHPVFDFYKNQNVPQFELRYDNASKRLKIIFKKKQTTHSDTSLFCKQCKDSF